jgi:DNA-binding transcriptional ArsR family regulator
VDELLLAALKALSDRSRLRIVGLLADRPYAVEEIADALGLAPGTVAHHLKRLDDAGLVEARRAHPYVEYALRTEALAEVGRRVGAVEAREAVQVAAGPNGEPLPAFDAKVLRGFFDGDRLVSIPAHEKKRQVVLRYLRQRCFEPGRTYTEPEVNQRLARFHPDVAALRRYLVDAGLMNRASGVYELAE